MQIKPKASTTKNIPGHLVRPAVIPVAETTKLVAIKDQKSATGRPLTLREKKLLIEE